MKSLMDIIEFVDGSSLMASDRASTAIRAISSAARDLYPFLDRDALERQKLSRICRAMRRAVGQVHNGLLAKRMRWWEHYLADAGQERFLNQIRIRLRPAFLP